jgi:FlaG/FlaF family flagellin (archaellin)
MPSISETLANLRASKNARMIFLGILLVILVILYFTVEKAKGIFLWLILLVAIAMGLEATDYDIDLGRLWDTGSVQESRVQSIKAENGATVRVFGSCIKDEINCSAFKTRSEAQAKYDMCATEIKKNNPSITDMNKLDIYGLDGNNNGLVCEALPAN